MFGGWKPPHPKEKTLIRQLTDQGSVFHLKK